MDINLVGLASAGATFLGVWIGHVSVRKIEREVERIWIPSAIALLLGIGLGLLSLWTPSRALSAFCAILGVTLLWDALEFHRQQNRIREGHAPANPRNPRHARILAAYAQATTIDWLDRDPRGEPVSTEDVRLLQENS
ncbi:MAG TPA: DUF4491 family protein [Anaerolineales bacterium]|nr:DUF4491 family protein [Anaerolineales bacterium]